MPKPNDRRFILSALILIALLRSPAALAYPALPLDKIKNCPKGTRSITTTEERSDSLLFQKSCFNQAGDIVREIFTKQSDGSLARVSELESIQGPAHAAYEEFYNQATSAEQSRLFAPTGELVFDHIFEDGKLIELMVSSSTDGKISERKWVDISFDDAGKALWITKFYKEWDESCISILLPNGLEPHGCSKSHDVVIDSNGKPFGPQRREAFCSDPKSKKTLHMKYSETADKKATFEIYGKDDSKGGSSEKIILRKDYDSVSAARDAVVYNFTPAHAALMAESPALRILESCGSSHISNSKGLRAKAIAEFLKGIEKTRTDLNSLF